MKGKDNSFLFLDADNQASRVAINLDNVAWVQFEGDQFNATSAMVFFGDPDRCLPLKGNQAALLQTELDRLVTEGNVKVQPK